MDNTGNGLSSAARDALTVQNACNLSGVVQSFATILTDVLWPAAREGGHGTDWVNNHPITALFVDKLQSLCSADVMAAYDECEKLAGGAA